MGQRLASSMRPTTYASAASCKHMIVCPWKCRSYLPTWRAISQTNCEKGSFWMRSPVLFWNWQISWRATVPSQYFWVFLTLPAFRNSFLGVLPPTFGWSFFLAGSSLPDIDGLASAAIWASCQVGNDCGDLPTSSSHFASIIHLIISSGPREVSCAGDGSALAMGVLGPWQVLVPWSWPPFFISLYPLTLSFMGCNFHPGHAGI